MENEKNKRKLTFNKANLVTWVKDEVDFGDEEEKDEESLFCLMALDDKINEVFDPNLSCSSDDDVDEIDDLSHKLYDSLVRAKNDLKLKITKNELLIKKIMT